jgi:16S rRNA (uracil1498-N3)-methyltransferase
VIRFFINPNDVAGDTVRLSAEDTDHIRSLRLRPNEFFTVCDGNGNDYVCRLGTRNDGTIAEITRRRKSIGEPSVACTVYIAYAKGERLDYAVQKTVELGAHAIVLYKSKRCIAVPSNVAKKIERLQRIAFETAKQCGRGIIPEVSHGGEFEAVVEAAVSLSELTLFCYEDENTLHLKAVLKQYFPSLREHEAHNIKSVSIITGPEGGYESEEAELAKSNNAKVVSLGPRILRNETAPVVCLSAIMYQTGNL